MHRRLDWLGNIETIMRCRHERVAGPAVLQLRKWSDLQVELNISEFCEVFLSPTRELLLLLSYQCEALLLPLTAGKISLSTSENGVDTGRSCFEHVPLPSTSSFCSIEQTNSSIQGPTYVKPSSYEPVHYSPKVSVPHGYCSMQKQCPAIFDVKSLTWGHCGDGYDQNFFKELLVVSGRCGVFIHCFRDRDENNETIKSAPVDGLVEGKWVNWGPSAASTDNLQAREHLSFSSKGSESFSGVKPVAGTEAHCDFSDSCFTVKCWLKSFLVAIETTKSENNLMTKFPVKPSLPRSAVVVSFAVNFSTPIFSDFLSCANPVSKANKEDTAWGKVTDHSLYPCTCSHLFSNSSHSLIGFVMTLPEHVPSGDTQAASCKASKVVVVVAMVHQWGIQWLFPVCLPDYSSELGPKFEWTDFKYSENYLLCLSSLGLVLAWSSTTGKLVARLDILQCCGMNASLKFAQTHSTAYDVSDIPVDQGKEVHGKMIQLVDYYYLAKGIFKKLMVPFNCSQFAAVDEYGIVYLFCEDDFVCEENDRANKLSHFYHGYGMFSGWTVADSDIGYQAVFSDPSRPQCSNILVGGNDRLSLTGYSYDVKPLEEVRHHVQRHRVQSEIILSGGSKKPGVHVTSTDISSIHIRRLLLPVYRFDRKDSIFFSSFGITRLANKCDANNQQVFKIVHTPLTMPSSVLDDGGLQSFKCSGVRCLHEQETVFPGQAIGFSFQGSFYLATQDGLFIVLPAVSISSSMLSGESFGYWQPILNSFSGNQMKNFLETTYYREQWPPWKLEVLDRTILYESPEEADRICLENGWELKIARLRCLHLALEYLKYEEIERSLEKLVDVNMAEEGILGLIFTSVYQIFCKVGNDSEVALASRFLALAARFATKMVRKYGLLELNKERFIVQCVKVSPKRFYPQETTSSITMNDINNLRRLQEMAYFLEIVRNLQQRLSTRHRKPGQQAGDGTNALSLSDVNVSQKDSPVPDVERVAPTLTDPLGVLSQRESAFPLYDMGLDGTEKLALSTIDSVVSPSDQFGSGNFNEIVVQDSMGFLQQRKFVSLENPKDMIARWKINNLDVKAVVKDALESGRLPLAVLQIHLQHLKDLDTFEKEPCDTFNEVRDVGRAIAYELFLKGETRLAIATLQRLGEDIETSLRQLVFGTVRKSLRRQIAAEMKRYGYLGPYEWKVLERISLIERLYPSSTFWGTYHSRQNQLELTPSPILLKGDRLQLTFSMPFGDYTIQCDEVDGTVIGYWINISESASFSTVKEDNIHAGYWAGAAAWSYAWDQRTMDRIVLDQPLLMGVHTLWESQLEYYVCHSDWDEVSKLLDVIPPSLLVDGSLQVNLDGLHSATSVKCGKKISDHASCFFHADELDSACINVPNVKIFRFSADSMCSMWLRMLIEKELAKKFIFMKEHWEGTAEIIWVLSRAGFIVKSPKVSSQGGSTEIPSDCSIIDETHEDTVQAFHKLVIHFCTQYNLPNFLDLYLDHHKAVLDYDSLISLQEAAADCQWAQWLLLSRIKGCEYDASFSNARSIMLHNMDYSNNLSVLEINEIIHTVDDMAEGGGEIAALATLMYAPVPIQECLCSGSVNRNYSSSAQCTLENLRPSLQQFPTLWRILVSACFGKDADICSVGFNSKRVLRKSSLSEYLNWREQIFSSTGGDTSLTQMLPCWFPNPIRRLVQIFVQGPFGWQSLSGVTHAGESFVHRDSYLDFIANDNAEVHAVSWEAAIQKNIEEELYASSLEKREYGVEHHLHRGRTLAAFNHLLSTRVGKLKSADVHWEPSAGSVHGQTNIQLDVQTLLAPLSENEESILSCVMPLAVLHYDDSALVGSCAFLLELCGLSASMLRVDIAALRRISFFYTSVDHSDQYKHLSPRGSAFHAIANEENLTLSLAQALAEDYQHSDNLKHGKCDTSRNGANRKPSRSVLAVLHHLEKASLPVLDGGNTCGSWLSSGIGDGARFRSQQKESSQHWNLVTTFCQLHRLPLSTKYLALLAKDNDWVGFFTEAQVGSFPFDVVIQVASEFSDPRLKMHILTVLKSLQSTRKKVNSSMNPTAPGRSSESCFSMETDTVIPVELFGILTKCEKLKNAGEALLMRAKDLRWSLLAMVASCFPDVSPLSCLTVWLEITAARETSSIKVNDFSSQIANNVGAAVEATNSLPAGNRTITFHYNRRNPKRRHLMEHNIGDMPSGTLSDSFSGSNGTRVLATQEIAAKEARKKQADEQIKVPSDPDEGLTSLSKMVAVLCEQRLFLPLLRAFEMFLPSCSLLPFIRSLQAFSQMRLSDAAAHLASFSSRVKEERYHMPLNITKDGKIGATWISSTAAKAADAMLSTCPSPYERRCLLQLLAAADFGDGGSAAACFRRLYWKINLAEPSLRKSDDSYLGNETLDDDASLLTALEKNGQWEQARNWARQLESSGAPWKSVVHHVTETQAEAMVTEWKEFLWDVPEERAALWGHCQTLFIRYAFPALQAGLFFLKHAEAVEKDVSARELHEMLLLALQWLSGTITKSSPVYPLHLLREIETRVWLLAVESEAQLKTEGDISSTSYSQNPAGGNSTSIVDQTASVIGKMDNHLSIMRARATERNENSQTHTRPLQIPDSNLLMMSGGSTKTKRRAKSSWQSRRSITDSVDRPSDFDDNSTSPIHTKNNGDLVRSLQLQEENVRIEASLSGWEERVGPAELERAVLSLLEFGQITAAKQLQQKLSPSHMPSEFAFVDAALKLAAATSPTGSGEASLPTLDQDALSLIQSDIISDSHLIDPLQALETLATKFTDGSGRGLCKRIIAVVKAANVLGLSFAEAFAKQPIELLQLLSLKAQDSLEQAKLLVQTHFMPPASIARILAESFLKGLLAAHRGGYLDSQKEEGPAPLLWRLSDFLKWAELCPSKQEIGHALMRLVITGQEIPHACEVELLILAHDFYKFSACLDGVDVLVALAATRVESYVSEGDFSCLARLVTGVSNFHPLNFIMGILIENGQLEVLLHKYSATEATTGTTEAARGFRIAVLTALKHLNPHDHDSFAMVYNHFNMKHEIALLLESQAKQSVQNWFFRYDKEQNEDLLEAMRCYIEAAEVYSSVDAGNKTRHACAQASLLSLQIRMPDLTWINLSETNARRVLVEQSRFQEALIVAEAYGLNQPSEWALVLWNQMPKPELTEQFVAEFVAVLPLHSSMLMDLAKFYRSEVAARGDQSHFSVWLSPGGLPAEWAKHLGRSFRCLLKCTGDLRLRMQLATMATGFGDVISACSRALDKMPEMAGPLILRKGHGGAYLPLWS